MNELQDKVSWFSRLLRESTEKRWYSRNQNKRGIQAFNRMARAIGYPDKKIARS